MLLQNKIEMAENYALELGQELENAAQYYREVEGYESPLFKSYFPRGKCSKHFQ